MVGSALVVVFQAFNTLDIAGPICILSNSNFSITVAAKDEFTTSQENIVVKRTISFSEAKKHLSDYDILLVPGSRSRNILPYVQPENGQLLELLDVIINFAKPESSVQADQKQRTILSVCVGSLLLGYAGVLDGLTATTHRLAPKALRTACEEYIIKTPGAKGTRIIPEDTSDTVSYCDAGINDSGVRVITSGAVTNGIDAALHFVALHMGRSAAVEVAELVGHNWREVKA